MSEISSINLRDRIKSACHYPNALGQMCYPLYKRATSTVSGGEADEAEYGTLARANSDPEWAAKVVNNYGSPRNIKRIFIGVNRAIVHFWVPIVKNGNKSDGLIAKINFNTNKIEDSELFPILEKGESDKHKVSNSRIGIGTIKEWALSNVEEIYFDWTALASKNMNVVYGPGEKAVGGNGMTAKGIVSMVYGKHLQMEDNAQFKTFVSNIIVKNRSLEVEYPRLKRVMMIENLDSLLDSTAYTGKGEDTVDKMAADWLDALDLKSSGLGYIGFKGSNYHKLSGKFRCTSNTYELDRLYLIDKFRDLSRDINRFEESNKASRLDKNAEVSNEGTTKNELDIYLNKLYDKVLSLSDKQSANRYIADTVGVLANLNKEYVLSSVAGFGNDTLSKMGGPIQKVLESIGE